MPLIPEDGTNVTGANSYGDLDGYKAYASARGLVIDADDTVLEQEMIAAMDFIEAQEPRFKGSRYYVDQALSFPRSPMDYNGVNVAGEIPLQLQAAQYRLAYDASLTDDGQLLATGESSLVTKEKIGPVEVEYSEKGSLNPAPSYKAAMALLTPLFTNAATGGTFSITR